MAEVLAAEKVVGTDRLLKLRVDVGDGERELVAGLAEHYSPEELVGKRVVVVVNLKPIETKGIRSEGMILAASDREKLVLVTTDQEVESGAKVG